MCFSSSTNTTQNQSSTGTKTPTNPDWVTSGASGLAGNILGLSNTNPQSYVAPSSQLQQYAYNAAPSILGNNPYVSDATSSVGQANSIATPTVAASTVAPTSTYSAQSAAPLMSQYMDPYTQQVVDASNADINHQAAIADQQAQSQATSAGAWNGTGEGVLRGTLAGNYSRDAATTAANLYNQGYQTSLGAAQTDAAAQNAAAAQNSSQTNQQAALQAQLSQQASTTNAGYNEQQIQNYLNSAGILGNLGQQSSSNLMNLNTLGQGQQTTAQAQAQSPLNLLGLQSSMFSGLPLNLFNGSNTTGTATGTGSTTTDPSLMSALGSGASSLSSILGLF